MSSGRQHFLYGTIAGCAALSTGWMFGADAEMLIGFGAGTAVGLMITPDMDLVQITYTETLVRRIPIVGPIVIASGMPYALLFRHRGLSHHWLFGTLSRIIYVFGVLLFWLTWLVGLMLIIFPDRQFTPQYVLQPTSGFWQAAGAFFLAWWFQDMVHIIADAIYSATKRWWLRHFSRHRYYRRPELED